jgi:hypothetical protein
MAKRLNYAGLVMGDVPQSAMVLRTTLMANEGLRLHDFRVKDAYLLSNRKDTRASLGL